MSTQPQIPERPSLPPRPKPFEVKVEQKTSPVSPPQQAILIPQQVPLIPQQVEPQNETYQAPSAIYEEIKDDIVSLSSNLLMTLLK